MALPVILGAIAGVGASVAKDFATEAAHDALKTVKKEALTRTNRVVEQGVKEGGSSFENAANKIKEWLF